MSLPDLYNTQISMHEWFERINHTDAQAVRDEDYGRQARLEKLYNTTGLPFDKPEIFSARDIIEKKSHFLDYFNSNKDVVCRLRLVPLDSEKGQKLRTVGRSVADSVAWLTEQEIDPDNYDAHFLSFTEQPEWATIFVINKHGMFGETVFGGHNQLTQGFHEKKPIAFSYDFEQWNLGEEVDGLRDHLEHIRSFLHVPDTDKQAQLTQDLDAQFHHNHIAGYFETVSDVTIPLQFIDYNRVLGRIHANLNVNTIRTQENFLVSGHTGCPGVVSGKVRIVSPEQVSQINLTPEEILVCDMTNPLYLPLMVQAGGIITDRGGILSHAAIVSRELGKPCIVGTGNATQVLQDGQEIEMDAGRGIVM